MSEEHTNLLQGEEDIEQRNKPKSSSVTAGTRPTPLPWRALSALLLLTSIQPLVFEIIFPFVNQMILEIGVVTDPEGVGFYSGLIESIFSCMSFITSMFFNGLISPEFNSTYWCYSSHAGQLHGRSDWS